MHEKGILLLGMKSTISFIKTTAVCINKGLINTVYTLQVKSILGEHFSWKLEARDIDCKFINSSD